MFSRIMATAKIVAVVCTVALSGSAWAESLPKPAERVVLTVSGDITVTNGEGVAKLDRALLRTLKVSKIRTTTPWTDGVHEFEGVLASDLMAALGAEGEVAVATAINDYKVEIPASDFTKFPVLLAWSMDGQELQVRDKGPIWIIYPQDQFEELRTAETKDKWIWQLKSLNFRG